MRVLDAKLLRDLRRLSAQSPAIALIPGCGVAAVEARMASDAILDLPVRVGPAVGRILPRPPSGPPRLNLPHLRSGA